MLLYLSVMYRVPLASTPRLLGKFRVAPATAPSEKEAVPLPTMVLTRHTGEGEAEKEGVGMAVGDTLG